MVKSLEVPGLTANFSLASLSLHSWQFWPRYWQKYHFHWQIHSFSICKIVNNITRYTVGVPGDVIFNLHMKNEWIYHFKKMDIFVRMLANISNCAPPGILFGWALQWRLMQTITYQWNHSNIYDRFLLRTSVIYQNHHIIKIPIKVSLSELKRLFLRPLTKVD